MQSSLILPIKATFLYNAFSECKGSVKVWPSHYPLKKGLFCEWLSQALLYHPREILLIVDFPQNTHPGLTYYSLMTGRRLFSIISSFPKCIYILGVSRQAESIAYINIQKENYSGSFTPAVTEAAVCKPEAREADTIAPAWIWRPENQESQWFLCPHPRSRWAKRRQMLQLHRMWFHPSSAFFVQFWPSADWRMPTCLCEGDLTDSVYWLKC